MKEKKKIALKSRLAKLGLRQGNIHAIMAMDDKILEKLSLVSSDKKLLEVLNLVVLKEKKYLSPQVREHYVTLYKNNQGKEEDNDYYYGLKLLNEAKDEYHLRIIYQILNNEKTKKYHVTLTSADIITFTETEFKANMAYNILTNDSLIELGLSHYVAMVVVNYKENERDVNYDAKIKSLLDTPEKIKKYLDALKYLKETLRVFVSHPDENMRVEAKEIDQSLNKLLGLVTLEKEGKEEKEPTKIGIPEYFGGLNARSLTLDDFKFKRRGRK